MRILSLILTCCILSSALSRSHAQDVNEFLEGGEFGLATNLANQLPSDDRDHFLGQVANAQGTSGQTTAGAQTASSISNANAWNDAAGAAGAGGGSFADFQSLMDLIQTTVVPDTWEALGGPSTMSPYPGGVFVDVEGTLQECEALSEDDAAANIKALLARRAGHKPAAMGDGSWRRPSAMRYVSLRRLRHHLASHRFVNPGWTPDENAASVHLAGLSKVQYIYLTEDDIVLAGPVGGIETRDGWHLDRKTGLGAIRTEFLFSCLAAAAANRPFGCTIDPTPAGMQKAAQVAAAVSADKLPIGKAAEAMQDALGMQRVEVFGIAGDTPIGYLMVEADRHMKQLALGKADMPDGVANYLDVIDAAIAKGTPNDMLLRLWFTAQPQPVRANQAKTVFELGGLPIKLSGENQRARADGTRGRIAPDFRSEAFVSEFNKHWAAIRTKYPVYSALESIYRAAGAAQLIQRYAADHDQLVSALSSEASSNPVLMPAPRQVMSIATHHSVRHQRKVHHVIVASGGVSVNPDQSIEQQLVSYPALNRMEHKREPLVVQRWWWD